MILWTITTIRSLLKIYVDRNSTRNVKFIKMRKLTIFITAVCVLFLIKLRWPKNKSLYDYNHRYKYHYHHQIHCQHYHHHRRRRRPHHHRHCYDLDHRYYHHFSHHQELITWASVTISTIIIFITINFIIVSICLSLSLSSPPGAITWAMGSCLGSCCNL